MTMPIKTVKQKISAWHSAGLTQQECSALLDTLPLNGATLDAFDYMEELYKKSVAKDEDSLGFQIIISGRHLRKKTDDALRALIKANEPARIFRHAGGLSRIEVTEEGQPIIRSLNESAARGELARVADWFTVPANEKIMIPTAPPVDVVRDLLFLPEHRGIPMIRSITENPVIRQDGSILKTKGYDRETFLYYYPSGEMELPEIPESPTENDIKSSRLLLEEVFCDFPFDSQISRTNILAAMITPIARPLIKGPTPLCVIDKPQVGSGASLIATVIAVISTGRSAAVMTAPRDPDEWRKTIVSTLMQGRGVVLIDNIEGSLYDSNLAAVLTATTFSARILGSNDVKDFPNLASWMATGNNVALGGDLPRRAYLVRIDAGVARPWLRDANKFKHPELEKWVTENRGKILAAILTMARAWIVAGKPLPEDLPRLGGYESWVRVIGGILSYAGIKGFLGNLSEMYERNDVETPLWTAFVAGWYDRFHDREITGSELLRAISESQDFETLLPIDPPHRDKKTGVVDDGGFTRKLGKALAARKGRIYPGGDGGDYHLIAGKTKQRAQLWQVKRGELPVQNSLNLEAKSEFGEFSTTSNAQDNSKVSDNEVGTNSQNSLTEANPRLDTKLTFTPGIGSNGIYPTGPCATCGEEEYGVKDNGVYYCMNCGEDYVAQTNKE